MEKKGIVEHLPPDLADSGRVHVRCIEWSGDCGWSSESLQKYLDCCLRWCHCMLKRLLGFRWFAGESRTEQNASSSWYTLV